MSSAPPPAPRTYDRKAVWGWALYDFAYSAYTTLVVTFVYAVFFTQYIVDDEIRGTTLWGNAVSITALVVAFCSPFMGALADRSGLRRQIFLTTTVLTAVGGMLLAVPGQGDVLLALGIFVLGNIAFELSSVLYNSYLPDVAPPDKIGRISGYGWALGYVGGLLLMVVALVGFIQPEQPWFGVPNEDGWDVRATMILVGIWTAVFALPMFLWVKEPKKPRALPTGALLRDTARQLKATFKDIRRYGQIFRLLIARLVYNDGLVTIFAFGPIYAAGSFGFTMTDVMVWGLALNLTAGLGAFAMGYLDDKIGGKKTILISLVGLTLASVAAVAATTRVGLWIAGLAVGIFAGPNQAASRSLLGRFVPRSKETEFYGFFAFSGKVTAFMGPFLLAQTTSLFQSQRAGVATIIIFFVVGALILWGVDEEEGRRLAQGLDTKGVA